MSLSVLYYLNYLREHLHISVIHKKPVRLYSFVRLKHIIDEMKLFEKMKFHNVSKQKHTYIFPITSNSPLLYILLFCSRISFRFLFPVKTFTCRFFSPLHPPSLQLSHPFSGRGDTAERLCLHPPGVRQPLCAGGSVWLPGVLYHLVPKQTGPETAVAGVPGHQQR